MSRSSPSILLCAAIIGVVLSTTVGAGQRNAPVDGSSSCVNLLVPGSEVELHRVRIVNRMFGAVAVSEDGGATWQRIGRVIRPLAGQYKAIGPKEFTAADWTPMGTVAATAVNAVHVKVDQLEPHAAVFSILPRELVPGADRPASYFDEPSTMYLDIGASTSFFGPRWSPVVGSPLFLEHPTTGALDEWKRGYAPRVGDRFVIVVRRPTPVPTRMEFQNRFDGRVTVHFDDGSQRVVARVLRPLTGTGRFGGTVYLGPGLLRANHPGVICFSTSPLGEEGGIQFIPAFHASEANLDYVRTTPAWMVLGPPTALGDDGDVLLEGTWPLFRGVLRPGAWRLLVRRRGSTTFEDAPTIAGKQLSALMTAEELAIVPVAEDRDR